MRPERLLLLGGTREAVALARTLSGHPDIETTYSLAGRTRRPAPVPAPVRTGGFGGADGLEAYLREAGIGLVVDATHPYAEAISANAALACDRASVPRLVLHRPPWARGPGDRWVEVADTARAARALPALGKRVLLTVGSRDLAPFLPVPRLRFVVRSVEPPAAVLDPERFEVVLARGPFDFDAERRLLESRANRRRRVEEQRRDGRARKAGRGAGARASRGHDRPAAPAPRRAVGVGRGGEGPDRGARAGKVSLGRGPGPAPSRRGARIIFRLLPRRRPRHPTEGPAPGRCRRGSRGRAGAAGPPRRAPRSGTSRACRGGERPRPR